ncbi:MAG: multiheme c-type cytochrome [Thermodesulfobacteriota bacterium]
MRRAPVMMGHLFKRVTPFSKGAGLPLREAIATGSGGIIAVLASGLILLPFAAHGQDKVFNILYTGAIKGELEPCGCSPKTESGGLARLSGYISVNRDALVPYVLVDAGNSIAEDTPQGRLKTEALIRSMNIIGYDVMAILKRDALLPEEFLSPLIEKYKAPVVNENGGHKSFLRAGFKVNISADPKGYKKGMLNILLIDKPIPVAASVKGWEVIVTSSGEIIEEPLKANGTVIVSGYPKGKMLGVLGLRINDKGEVSGFTHRWQPLGKEIKEDKKVRNVLNEYDATVAMLLKDEERKVSSNGPFLGDSNCVSCHQPFMDAWKGSRHAGAFNTLVKAGKSKDPECVKCHTTGFGEEGGFYSNTSTPGLVNVQCEACHGPGREHGRDFTAPTSSVVESVCLRCHTEDNSPDFDFRRYLEKIKH